MSTLKLLFEVIRFCLMIWNVFIFRYWLYPDSAKNVDIRIQKGLFLFACTNSCMNPIVYGAFNIRTRRRAPGQVRPRSTSSSAITCTTDIRLPALSISLRNVEWPLTPLLSAEKTVRVDLSKNRVYSTVAENQCSYGVENC